MNTNKQIFIDKTILKRVGWMLNILVSIAGKIIPKKHDLSQPFKKIAVCKLKGLGSIIQSTPLLQTLKTKYPEAQIIFISTSSNEPFLKKIDLIDEIIILNDHSLKSMILGFFPFISKIFNAKIDIYVDLEVYSNFSGIITALSNAQNRFGYYLKESHYKMGIYTHMMYYNNAVPIYQTYLQWARLLQCNKIQTPLYKFESTCNTINLENEDYSLPSKKYFVINPNASDLRIERRWSKESFHDLIKELQIIYPDIDILLIGSKNERAYVNSVFEENEHVKNIAGKTTIDELIAVIQNAEMVITNDTGPMHLSFAMEKKTVALFGPCAPSQYGAHTNTAIIYKNVYCSPCVHEFRIPPCMGNNQCMKQITLIEVVKAIEKLKNNEIIIENKNDDRQYWGTNNHEALGIITRKSF